MQEKIINIESEPYTKEPPLLKVIFWRPNKEKCCNVPFLFKGSHTLIKCGSEENALLLYIEKPRDISHNPSLAHKVQTKYSNQNVNFFLGAKHEN